MTPPVNRRRPKMRPELRGRNRKVMMTEAWWRLVDDAAEALGESRSAYIRRAVAAQFARGVR